jgi:hypothetical protein
MIASRLSALVRRRVKPFARVAPGLAPGMDDLAAPLACVVLFGGRGGGVLGDTWTWGSG